MATMILMFSVIVLSSVTDHVTGLRSADDPDLIQHLNDASSNKLVQGRLRSDDQQMTQDLMKSEEESGESDVRVSRLLASQLLRQILSKRSDWSDQLIGKEKQRIHPGQDLGSKRGGGRKCLYHAVNCW